MQLRYWILLFFSVIYLIAIAIKDYNDSPKCPYCKGRHVGSCIFKR